MTAQPFPFVADGAISVRLLLSGLARPKEKCGGTPKPSPS
jgi:hypothetical protein